MATLTYLTSIFFDFGAVQNIPAVLSRAGISNASVATDAGIKAAGQLEKMTHTLGEEVSVSISDETLGNSLKDDVEVIIRKSL